MRPWTWLLTRTTECRIFQKKKAPDIIKEIMTDRGFSQTTHWETKLSDEGSFPELDYCVQYRETDFAFISRLMEREGIYFYFTHKDGQHMMVLANSAQSHKDIVTLQNERFVTSGPLPPPSPSIRVPFQPVTGAVSHTSQYVETWISERKLRSGVFEFNDYNYETPNQNMVTTDMGVALYKHSMMEVFDHPGEYAEPDVGRRYVKIAMESEQSRDHRRQATGEAPSLFPGGLTTLRSHPSTQQNVKYLVVRARHSYGDQGYRTGPGAAAANERYSGQYELLPASHPFRAPIVTPKPRIHGAQTAVVVDKDARGRVDQSPEEIEVEKLTEIYVSFFWDRRQHKEKRSCKVRCAQMWAGKKWGAQFIPRIGMEVVVEFIEGDPDRPLVTGCVYNETNQPPFSLPGDKTISGIKSESSKGGNGYNMWNFQDKKGHEQINFHAQKDMNITVLSNETRSVGGDVSTTIGHSQTTTIGKNFKPPTGKSSRTTTLKNGDDQLDVENGAILYTAKTKIVLTVGPSSITIDPTGITLDAPTITIKAKGLNTIQGLPVKIN